MNSVTPLVVYVDGYESNRVVFKAQFAQQFNVACYESVDPIHPILAKGSVGLLIVDPEWSVYRELLLATRQRFPRVPCAVFTARNEIAQELTAADPALRAIIKPWRQSQVVACLTDALNPAPTPLPRRGSSSTVLAPAYAISGSP